MLVQYTLSILGLFLCTHGVMGSGTCHWTYSAEEGPNFWGTICHHQYKLCGEGTVQSPVDIRTSLPASQYSDREGGIDVNWPMGQCTFENNGHTVKATVPAGSTTKFNDETYNLLQLHFHTPSENWLNGKRYPMTTHFVHSRVHDGETHYAVVTVLYDISSDPNYVGSTFIAQLAPSIPQGAGNSTTVTLNPFTLRNWQHPYYKFCGSFTTPPCTEGVRWFVFAEPEVISMSQYQAFNSLMGFNARPEQNLNERKVLYRVYNSSAPASPLGDQLCSTAEESEHDEAEEEHQDNTLIIVLSVICSVMFFGFVAYVTYTRRWRENLSHQEVLLENSRLGH